MGRNKCKKDEHTQNKNAFPPPKDHNSLPAREQSWMENESDELTETGFRRWVIINFSELKEHVITQWKETKNIEKRLDEMLVSINSIERNINELMELTNTTYTSFNSWIEQEERISEIEDQLNETKWEGKIREKKWKEMNKASKKYGIMWKDLIHIW